MWKYLYKEILEGMRYRIIWLNLFVTPFFMFAPFVYLVEQNAREDVLIGLLCWYELNQLFFGISNCLIEERMNGTFVNLFIMPIEFFKYLFSKGIWIMTSSIIIILFTIGIFSLFGIYITNFCYLLCLLVANGFFIYGMSVFYLSFVIRFRRLGRLNSIIQQILGFCSGYTSDVYNFPSYLKTISSLIPLTYIILLARDKEMFNVSYLFIAAILSLLMYLIGRFMVKKQWNKIRKIGDMNLW